MNARPVESRRVNQPSRLANLLEAVPPGLRGAVLIRLASAASNASLESRFAMDELRDAFTKYWEDRFGTAPPLPALRSALDPPIPVRTAIEFSKFAITRDAADIDVYLSTLAQYLADGNQVERRLF